MEDLSFEKVMRNTAEFETLYKKSTQNAWRLHCKKQNYVQFRKKVGENFQALGVDKQTDELDFLKSKNLLCERSC